MMRVESKRSRGVRNEPVGARQMVRVALAALVLVVLQRDVRWTRAADRHLAHQLEAEHRVAHDLFELDRVERARLVQHPLVDVHLADVVQQAAERQVLQVLVIRASLRPSITP